MTFDKVFGYFLSRVSSESLANLEEADLLSLLHELLDLAIADFNFPYCSLEYAFDADKNEYVFTDPAFSVREVNVLIELMKKLMLEQELDGGESSILYFDRDVKTFSGTQLAKEKRLRLNALYKSIRTTMNRYYESNNGKAEIATLYERDQ